MISDIDYQESSNIKSTYFNLQNNKYFNSIREIHLVLSNNSDLDNDKKLDLCSRQRYLIKIYLHQLLKKLEKNGI